MNEEKQLEKSENVADLGNNGAGLMQAFGRDQSCLVVSVENHGESSAVNHMHEDSSLI